MNFGCGKFLHNDDKRAVHCGENSRFLPWRKKTYCSKCFGKKMSGSV